MYSTGKYTLAEANNIIWHVEDILPAADITPEIENDYEWAKVVVRVASALEGAGVSKSMVEMIVDNHTTRC